MNSIVERIKSLSKERNLKISVLLRKAELSPNVIDDWQNKKTEPSIPALCKICEVLNIDIGDLFTTSELQLTQSQMDLLKEWNLLNAQEKQAIFDYISALLSNHK